VIKTDAGKLDRLQVVGTGKGGSLSYWKETPRLQWFWWNIVGKSPNASFIPAVMLFITRNRSWRCNHHRL